MVEHSRQALVGAIGGTYISLATTDIDELTISNFALLNSADFASPMQAIERYIKTIPRCPDKIALSVAGVVDGETAAMSYLPWSFDWNDIRAATGAQHIRFVNEFEALALAMPHMTDYDLIEIGRGTAKLHGTKAVISAGTGLGTAALVWTGEKWHAHSGESRYSIFAGPLGDEFDVRPALAVDGVVEMGQILSGRGLVVLYQAIAKAQGQKIPAKPTPQQITKAGLSGEDEAASAALDLMATWLGRFAGDIALHFGAVGGVYLAGGLPSNIVSALQTGRFREAFDGSAERRTYLAPIPVKVLKTGADAGLRGAAVALADSLPVRANATRRLRA